MSNQELKYDDYITDYFNNNLKNILDDNFDDDLNNKLKTDNVIDSNFEDKILGINYETNSDVIIGIDLGTTNSCVAIWRNNNLEIIPDNYGCHTTPSIVAFGNKTRFVGIEAKNQTEINPKKVIYEIKRLIGCKFSDESVKNDIEFLTYNICPDSTNNNVLVNIDNKNYTPEEISAMILSKLKNDASRYLKCNVIKAVITVPANFNDSQRQATKDAATIAGLDCVRIIHEPTAAALAYGLMNKSLESDKDIKTIVFDLGGGTIDVSLLNISNGIFEVLGSVGNTHLGGADFDTRIMKYCILKFKKKFKYKDIKINILSLQKLKKLCENAKKILSTSNKTIIAIKNFYDSKDLFIEITRDILNEICNDLLILCMEPISEVLNTCNISKNDIDEIILVGGMTRMPIIRTNISNYFNDKKINCSLNPDEIIATGAAIQGFILSDKKDPFSESMTLLDIIPLSLGVETIGGVMDVIISRNTIIPVTKKRLYTTTEDYEDSVTIKIFEGERKMTKDNFFVGEFELKGIEPKLRGCVEIEVKFSIDVNGIITVTAEDADTKSKNSIIITGNKSRLSQEKINMLIQEAKNYELKDKLEKCQKQYYYEITDHCSCIKLRIDNKKFKFTDNDKKSINNDIDKILSWLIEKPYYERSLEEYKEVLNKLRKRYYIILLDTSSVDIKDKKIYKNNPQSNPDNDYSSDDEDDSKRVKGKNLENSDFNATSIYENEDENINDQKYDNFTYEDELCDANKNQKNELKQIKNTLQELCYNLFDILSSGNLKLSNDDISELKDYIDDILLWIHVVNKPKINDYKEKIDFINTKFDIVLEKYNNDLFEYNELVKNIKSNKDELEQLCCFIKCCISDNQFSFLDSEKISILNTKIDNIFQFLHTPDISEDDCKLKLDEINNFCNELINKQSTNHDKNNIEDINPIDDKLGGVSVQDLIKKKLIK